MKRILFILVGLSMVWGLFGCDPEKPPKFRVKNDRGADASLQVKTSGGNTININNVKPGTLSAYQDVAAGKTDITVDIQGETGSFTGSFVAATNSSYTVVVANTTPPTVNVVSP